MFQLFFSAFELKKHILTHFDVKRYTCLACKKQLKNNSCYRWSVYTVQGQKYSCKLCSKDYSALMGLNIHKRNVHGIITWIKKIQQILKNSSDVRDIKKRNHEFSNSQNQSSAKRPESLLKPLSNGVLFLKGHSLYQISSKMLHGLKVFYSDK